MKLGYFSTERIMGQEVLVSLSAEFNLAENEKIGDHLERSVDYGIILNIIDETLRDREVKLIENAVETVAVAILKQCPRIESLCLTIEKPILPHGMSKGAKVSVSETFRQEYLCS